MIRSIEPPWLRTRIAAARQRIDIVAVIAEVIDLRLGRAARGKCPFHGSSRQTFHVSPAPARGYPYAHCFGCGWHGDVIRFVADFRRIDFNDALALLESGTGVLR